MCFLRPFAMTDAISILEDMDSDASVPCIANTRLPFKRGMHTQCLLSRGMRESTYCA